MASLDIFEEVGMSNLIEKRDDLTAYLEFIVNDISENNKRICNLEIITPKDKTKRGAQLSILAHGMGKSLFDFITKKGVIADWREPNVIRIAPVPLYNSYKEVFRFGEILEEGIQANDR